MPAPGSEQAIDKGCTCPVLDNNHGKGAYTDSDGKPVFWYNMDCPMHSQALHIPMDTMLYPME